MEIIVRNVNELFSEMFWRLRSANFINEYSRNGPVIRFPEPVMTTINRPQERVLFHENRDANPIFHLMESMWMLAGRRDVAFVQQFNSKIGQYSDDGENFNAAYGYRLRHHFGNDQLLNAIELLKADKSTRRVVLQLWDPADLTKQTKDMACNVEIILSVNFGKLDMLVLNRSNDMWYGYAGANPVHFTVIQEFVANAVGIPMGVYRTFSNNLHLYTDLYDATSYLESPPDPAHYDGYGQGVKTSTVVDIPWRKWLEDCELFCKYPFEPIFYGSRFLRETAHPMAMVSYTRKNKLGDGMVYAERIEAEDWCIATKQWIARREKAKSLAS